MRAGRSPGLRPTPKLRRHAITADRRIYTEAEFALILRKAAEIASRTETPGDRSGGLTLAEMKAAAAEAGIDPALVERAARLLPARSSASLYARLIGGPRRHDGEIRLPVRLDEATAAQLLAAVQIGAGRPGTGHASAVGMVWHAKDDMESLSVTARPEDDGTTIAVHVDRTGTLAAAHFTGFLGVLGTTLAAMVLGSEVAPALGAAAGVTGVTGILALGRAYWSRSTRRVRERVNGLMDSLGELVARLESPSTDSDAIGGRPETPRISAQSRGDAS